MLLSLIGGKLFGLENNTYPSADFKITYSYKDISYAINNSTLPDAEGIRLPYQINCHDISTGANSYEWLVKYPSHDYVLVDTVKNPLISIERYGPVYIKIRLNGLEKFSKEYYVAASDYLVKKQTNTFVENQKGTSSSPNNTKTTIESISTYISPENSTVIMPKLELKDPKIRGKSNFKISYNKGNIFYNVTNRAVPEIIKTLPYKVSLTNIDKVASNFVWYVKPPNGDYVWMDDSQGVQATLWNYGTTFFKLAINGDVGNATEYSVTAYPPEKEALLNVSIRKAKTAKHKKNNADFKLKYYEPSNNEIFDVTNATVTTDFCKLPYSVLPINVSKGDIKSEWFVKKAMDSEYQPITEFPIKVDSYGPLSIKLRVNGDDKLISEKKITSFFSIEEGQ